MTLAQNPGAALALRDIHRPPAPSWWPPAPGWWCLAAVALLLVLAAAVVYWRRRKRRMAMAQLFDRSVEQAGTPAAQIAAMSELLRRAALVIDPAAGALAGDAWLQFLDRGMKQPVFTAGAGAMLRDGAFRRELSPVEVDAVRSLARARFLAWMAKR
jgi:uncharacterized protein DUF4381